MIEHNDTLYTSSAKEQVADPFLAATLKDDELRLQNLVQNLPAAFYATDQYGNITFYNEAAVELWGRRPEIGKELWCGSLKIFELDGITEVPLDECPMALALKKKQKIVTNDAFIVERPDGTRKYFIPYPTPIFDSEGNLTGATNMLMDVTESRMAEEQKARLVAIVQSSGDAIISKTLNSIITSWNKGAEKIFGYKAEEIIGQSIFKIIPADRRNEEAHIIQKIKKGELIDHYQTKRLTKNGDLIDISLTISPIKDTKGKIIGVSKIARDITQMKMLERHKDDFIKMASHELKTPVTSINGYVQLLLNLYKGQKDNNHEALIKTSLQTIEKQVSKLTRLISEMLDLSKIESLKFELRNTEFNLEELLEETVQEARQLTSKHAIIFRSDFDGKIIGDRDRIGQAITNLLDNAIKYSPNSDHIEVTLRSDRQFANITVTDHGIGIDSKDHEKIFEQFYRAEGKMAQTYPGFGIGLFICSEIIRLHRGTITVKSEKDKGSVFVVTLPINPEKNTVMNGTNRKKNINN